uniref:Contactin associated protein like 3 n=1 Tax=Fundulus heteroclitus TaxID=8078 RepID=A0A3Q2TC59_FUNHE
MARLKLYYSVMLACLPRMSAGGWSPIVSDGYQWLEVDLGERTKITAVATQGRYGSSDWLKSYQLMFSDLGHNWKQYRQEDSIGFFPGNTNADSVVQYKLQQPVVARFLRLIPLDWNPSGRIGLRLETYGCPYRDLDGSSRLVYRLGPGPRRTQRDVVTLKVKTLRNAGTLLQAEGREGLSLSLELERGKLLLLFRQGRASSAEPRRIASLASLLDDQHWHYVAMELHGLQLNLTVDKHTLRVKIPTEFHHLDIHELSVGAVQGLRSHKLLHSKRNFHGCLENLVFNGLNLIELAKFGDQRVTLVGNVTFSCAEPVSVAVTFPGPQSFLQLPWTASSSSGSASIGFQFRTWNKAGLLLTFDLPRQGGVARLFLSEARLRLQVQKGGRVLLELSAGELKATSELQVNRRLRLQHHVESHVFFGGKSRNTHHFNAFHGCMRLLSLDNRTVDLIAVQKKQLGNYSNLQIDMCGIIDRCSPSRCEHGGLCSQTWTVFHCNCSDSGYSGATCHTVYEQSCEAYKHNGNTSGYFYIDVDGSGPIKPQLVYCNMTGKTNTSPSLFNVHSEDCSISQSEHCEQELSYHCKKSRLLNTPGIACFIIPDCV